MIDEINEIEEQIRNLSVKRNQAINDRRAALLSELRALDGFDGRIGTARPAVVRHPTVPTSRQRVIELVGAALASAGSEGMPMRDIRRAVPGYVARVAVRLAVREMVATGQAIMTGARKSTRYSPGLATNAVPSLNGHTAVAMEEPGR